MIDFTVVLRIVVFITVASGALAVTVAILGALMPMPLAAQLVGVFTDTCRLGAAAIVGLIAGRAGHSRGLQ